MTEQRKRGAKGVPRTELVATRFDPRTKYLLEIAARVQRRSVANYVEWAVGESFKNLQMPPRRDGPADESVESAANVLWDPSEAQRLVLLTMHFPSLLTYEEHTLWKLCEDTALVVFPSGLSIEDKVAVGRFLRTHWDVFTAAASAGLGSGQVALKIERLMEEKKKNRSDGIPSPGEKQLT